MGNVIVANITRTPVVNGSNWGTSERCLDHLHERSRGVREDI